MLPARGRGPPAAEPAAGAERFAARKGGGHSTQRASGPEVQLREAIGAESDRQRAPATARQQRGDGVSALGADDVSAVAADDARTKHDLELDARRALEHPQRAGHGPRARPHRLHTRLMHARAVPVLRHFLAAGRVDAVVRLYEPDDRRLEGCVTADVKREALAGPDRPAVQVGVRGRPSGARAGSPAGRGAHASSSSKRRAWSERAKVAVWARNLWPASDPSA